MRAKILDETEEIYVSVAMIEDFLEIRGETYIRRPAAAIGDSSHTLFLGGNVRIPGDIFAFKRTFASFSESVVN